jgi:hypothetical protein
MNDETTHELVDNPVTGVPEKVLVGEAGRREDVAEAQQGVALRRIMDEDDEADETTYEHAFQHEGRVFNVDLMKDPEYVAYVKEEKRLTSILSRADGSADLTQTYKVADEFYAARLALVNTVMERKVKGYNGRMVSKEKRLKLFFPDKVRVAEMIVQASRIGKLQEDFLAPS